MKENHYKQALIILFLSVLFVFLLAPDDATAGVWDASNEVTYKEYWVPHSEFTGGCGDSEQESSWYIEPYPNCEKTLEFQIPDDFTQGERRAEIYLDLWRNYESHLAKFSLNDNVVHQPNVGSKASRTPYIGEISLDELRVGTNTIHFFKGGYHVHDIAIRIYYDEENPLIPGTNSDVTPPDGSLLTIQGDGAPISAGAGGNLQVDNDQLTLTAEVSDDAAYVEFHSHYFGYDEDNDGRWRDWHNRGHNNWFPGGKSERSTGGAIDHPGTKATPSAGQYSVNWDVSTVPDQEDVKFKIRVVDDAGNVREAAGGVSKPFSLSRTQSLLAFWQPGFDDYFLWGEGKFNPEFREPFFMPFDYDATDYTSLKIVQSFWRFAIMQFNESKDIWWNFPEVDGSPDFWQLSVPVPSGGPSIIWPGYNRVDYRYPNVEVGPGTFVEKPGPMLVLKQAPWTSDDSPPAFYNLLPEPNEKDVSPLPVIQAQIADSQSGLQYSTLLMKVDGEAVDPTRVEGAKHTAYLYYVPPAAFEANQRVEVFLEICDLAGNCTSQTYTFDVEGESLPTDIVSDDFNSCSLDAVWEFRDAVGNSSVNVNGKALEISVPAGSNHDLWQGANDAPRVMQPANDTDFRISARFNTEMDAQYQMQGFIVGEDAQNFIRFSMRHDGTKAYLEIYVFEKGVPVQRLDQAFDDSLPYLVPTNLAVERFGNTWRYLYLDQNEEWLEVRRFDYAMDVTEVGLFAGNKGVPESTAPAFTSSVDFFFDDNAPIDPQDQDPLFLPVEIVGSGTVQKTPLCGNPVTLTADPAAGSFFQGWSSNMGSLSGRSNPLTGYEFATGEVVTASFHVDELLLNVDVDNDGTGEGGSVTISPEKAVYNFEDEVTLIPNTPTGWDFLGWSGDVNPGDENDNPLLIMMDDDISVTASFAAQPVALQTSVIGEGVIELDPDQGTDYQYGDLVSLTAVPADGWRFDRWQGVDAASSFVNPLDYVLTEDTVLTAVFVEQPPYVFFPVAMTAE